MRVDTEEVLLIEDEHAMQQFIEENKEIDWLCFDTEFVGEKRYVTLICLIQIATENGFYFIDTLKLDNIDPFLDLLEDASILKITHAGENDYRLLQQQMDVIPRNVFDTQIVSGFAGYKYQSDLAEDSVLHCEANGQPCSGM